MGNVVGDWNDGIYIIMLPLLYYVRQNVCLELITANKKVGVSVSYVIVDGLQCKCNGP